MTSMTPGPTGNPDPRDPNPDARGTNRGWGCTWWWWVLAILVLLAIAWWAAFGSGRYDDDAAIDPAVPVNPAPVPAQ